MHALLAEQCPQLAPVLLTEGTPLEARHGAIDALRAGGARLLVCTDVASRGLDFPSVRHVVMYDLPRDVAAFIHRAGRTARVGRDGQMSCLVQPHELNLYKELHQGEAVPGTALHRSAGRAGVAPKAARVPQAEQRGWISRGDLDTAERSMAVAYTRLPPPLPKASTSADFADALNERFADEEDAGPALGSKADRCDGGTVGKETWLP